MDTVDSDLLLQCQQCMHLEHTIIINIIDLKNTPQIGAAVSIPLIILNCNSK